MSDEKLFVEVGDENVQQMVNDIYPRLVQLAQDFLSKHDLMNVQERKDILFSILFSYGRILGQLEGLALELGVAPETLFSVVPKLLVHGRMSPLRVHKPN